MHAKWAEDKCDEIINQALANNKERKVDVVKMLSERLALALTCFVLGLKNVDEELNSKIISWAHHSADTGGKFSLEENVDNYLEGHDFFMDTIKKVIIAIEKNDES
jgi:hypothetical protein